MSTGGSLHLLLHIGDSRERVLIRLAERIVLGRASGDGSPGEPDLDLTPFGALEYGVSRQHAAILYANKALRVEDLGSRNGTRINGLTIPPGAPTRIYNGDELELGRLRLTLRLMHVPVK